MTVTAAAPAGARCIGDRYQLLGDIGSGGMGTVWRGHDLLLNRPVAVKEIYPSARLTPEERASLRERSIREARAAARLNSTAAVTVYDVLEQDDRPWIVMELLEARSLAKVIHEEGPLSPPYAARIGFAILDALQAAHAAGVVHRDVKPANVLLADDGRIVLTDFGVATFDGDASTTQTGTVVGSPAYMAPERAKGAAPAQAMDLWSLGATLFHVTEGQAPFSRPDALTTLHALLTDPVPTPRRAGVLRPVIMGLLQRDPDQRLDVAAARALLEDALRHAEMDTSAFDVVSMPADASTDASTAPLSPAEPPREPSGATPGRNYGWMAALGLTPVVIAAGILLHGGNGPAETSPAVPPAQAGVNPAKNPAGTPVPPGYRLHRAGTYAIAVPERAQAKTEGRRTSFRGLPGNAFLAVEELADSGGNLVSALGRQERAARELPGYTPGSISTGEDGRWAGMEFRWNPVAGAPLQVRSRVVHVSPSKTMRFYFSAPQSAWADSQEAFEVAWSSFDVAGNKKKSGV